MSRLRRAGWPSCVAKGLTLDITRKLFNQFVHTCHTYGLYWPFYTSFTDLNPAWESQNQRTHFIRSGYNLMWWWSNSSWASWDCFWVRVNETREIAAGLKRRGGGGGGFVCLFVFCMHSDVYKWIWFKLDMMTGVLALYVLILVLLILICAPIIS